MISLKLTFAILAFTALAGCGSLSKEFDNEFACGADGQAYAVSMYGPLGIASKLNAPKLCTQIQGEKK